MLTARGDDRHQVKLYDFLLVCDEASSSDAAIGGEPARMGQKAVPYFVRVLRRAACVSLIQ